MTPTATGQTTITINLAPASYAPPQTQQATLSATSTTLDLAAVTPTRWIGQGATIAVPLTVEALDLGVPTANVTVNFAINRGTASLSSGSATTNGSGFATITANLANLDAEVQVSACVAPNNSPCQIFTLLSTTASLWTLETVSGSPQIVPTGQAFQPLVMRVTDGSSASNPVMGVTVTFQTTLARVSSDPGSDQRGQPDADSDVGGSGVPVLLGSSEAQVVTDQNGLASIVPSAGSVGPCDVFITVSAGPSTVQLQMESLAAITTGQPKGIPAKAPTAQRGSHFGAPTPAPSIAPDVLFAVPQGPPDDPAASQGPCPDAPDTASSTGSVSGAAATPAAGNVVPPPCESASKLPPAEAEVPPPAAEPPTKSCTAPPANSAERDQGGGATPPPAAAPAENNSPLKHSAADSS